MSLSDLPKILIVDDSEDDRFLTERLLETVGFVRPFTAADSAAGAMELLSSDPFAFDVAFLDIRMPMMDGFELLAWIRSRPHWGEMKIVMLTSSDDAHDIERAKQLRADGYLLKTDPPEKCAAILAAVLPQVARHGSASAQS